MKKTNEFQMRLEDGYYRVFMTRKNGTDVPRLQQRAVWVSPYQPRAQIICDALSNGLLTRILLAMEADESSTQVSPDS